MKILSIILLLVTLHGNSQMISTPSFREPTLTFETAKINRFNTKTKTYGAEIFKTCTVIIEYANTTTPTISVDMPDIYYCKNLEVYSIKYEKDETSEYVTYMVKDDKYICGISIFWGTDYRTPLNLNVSFTNISTTPQIKSYKLYEFK